MKESRTHGGNRRGVLSAKARMTMATFMMIAGMTTTVSAFSVPSSNAARPVSTVLRATAEDTSAAATTTVLPTGADYEAYRVSSVTTCPEETGPTRIPAELPDDFPAGTYYRNGGARFESDDGQLVVHPFDADGMVCAATLDPSTNSVVFRNTFVETEGYLDDKATGTTNRRGIFGTMRSPGGILANAFRTDFKNVANTNAVFANDKVYALWEGGRPYELDPLTLRNTNGPGIAGETDLGGLLAADGASMSAHPRYDATADTWITFGYGFDPATASTTVDLYELNATTFRSDRVKGRLRFTKEGPGLIHDFIVSPNWMVFNLNKASVSAPAGLRAILGLGAFAEFIDLDREATDTQIVLIPRALFDEVEEEGSEIVLDVLNDDRVRVVDLPFHFNFHFSNCYEDEHGQVVFETVQTIQRDLLTPPPPPDANARLTENPGIWDWLYPSVLTRYSLDPAKESLSVGVPPKILVDDRPTEFPVVPKALSTKPHRYVYASGGHRAVPGSTPETRGSGPQQGSLIKVDTAATAGDHYEVYEFEPHEFVGEFCFVAKVGADVTDPSREDAGYLVSYLVNGRDRTTELVILDAEDVPKGPVARIPLPTFVPTGLHGCFAPGVVFDDATTTK